MYFPPAQAFLGTVPVGLERWLVLSAIALIIAVAIEFHKLSWKLRYSSGPERAAQSALQTPERET